MLPLIHFILYPLTYSVPLFLKRQWNGILGGMAGARALVDAEQLQGHVPELLLRALRRPLARGDTVIFAANDSNHSKIRM